MRILAIETSCDETAIALIEAGGDFSNVTINILGNVLLSQVGIHKEYGGVYPNLAKREHQKNLIPLLKKVLDDAGRLQPKLPLTSNTQLPTSILEREPELLEQFSEFIPAIKPPNIDVIAVTSGPGLEVALWVGINFAKALAHVWEKPVVAVDHMEGHVFSALLKTELRSKNQELRKQTYRIQSVAFPALALLISGGHTELVLMKDWLSYVVIGETLDDAVGEAFDKVACMLNLPYPGGPEISRLAEEARAKGLTSTYELPRPMIRSENLNFSFSGLKTAVLYTIQKIPDVSDNIKRSLAFEFENAVTDVLTAKVRKALERYGAKTLLIGGGVSANKHIQRGMREMIENDFPNTELFFPDSSLTGDNAMMIAVAAYFRAQKGIPPKKIVADGNQRL